MTATLPLALGLDTGAEYTGIALVRADDTVLHAEVLRCKTSAPLSERILMIQQHLLVLVRRARPQVLAIETYTAPTSVVHARSAHQWAAHNWLIGACLGLATRITPPMVPYLLDALDWQRALTGIRTGRIGGKRVLRRCVEARTGYRFATPCTDESGGHDSDSVGVALIALDRYMHAQRIDMSLAQ